MRKNLTLAKETLTDLTPEELGGIWGGSLGCISNGGKSCSVCSDPHIENTAVCVDTGELTLRC